MAKKVNKTRLDPNTVQESVNETGVENSEVTRHAEITYYDSQGNSAVLAKTKENETSGAAKYTRIGNQEMYHVKRGRTGLYNPKEVSGRYSLSVNDRITGREMFRWSKTTKMGFNNYIQFLQTGHKSLLTAAEREG